MTSGARSKQASTIDEAQRHNPKDAGAEEASKVLGAIKEGATEADAWRGKICCVFLRRTTWATRCYGMSAQSISLAKHLQILNLEGVASAKIDVPHHLDLLSRGNESHGFLD